MWLWLVPLGQSGNTKYALDAYCLLVTSIENTVALLTTNCSVLHWDTVHTHTNIALTLGKKNRPVNWLINLQNFPQLMLGVQTNVMTVVVKKEQNLILPDPRHSSVFLFYVVRIHYRNGMILLILFPVWLLVLEVLGLFACALACALL